MREIEKKKLVTLQMGLGLTMRYMEGAEKLKIVKKIWNKKRDPAMSGD